MMETEAEQLRTRRALIQIDQGDMARLLQLPPDVSIRAVHADFHAVYVVLESPRFERVPFAADPPIVPIDTDWTGDGQ